MKQSSHIIFLALALVLVVVNVSANPELSEVDDSKNKLPTTPAELLVFLTGTTWQLKSGVGQYFGEGTVVFLEKGKVEHIYKDGAMHRKSWGVTNDMKLIWGGKYMQVCRFSPDFKTFTSSRHQTMGRRMMRQKPDAEVTTKN